MKNFSSNSFVAGIMVGVLLAGLWFLGGDATSRISALSLSQATTTDVTVLKSNSISVVNQPAGDTVIVESVTVPPPGVWVAVREVTGSDLGNVLGAARVSGPRSNVSIALLRATEPGRAYAVQLYRDDDNGSFDVAVNSVYVDFDTGARVVAYFKTTE